MRYVSLEEISLSTFIIIINSILQFVSCYPGEGEIERGVQVVQAEEEEMYVFKLW